MSIPVAVAGQTLRVNAVFGVDITGATSVLLKYKTPTGTPGQIVAFVDAADVGEIYGIVPAGTLTAGDWTFWAEAVTTETIITYGKIIRVVAAGTVVMP